MKKLFLLMALFATTVFVACSDDDDNAQINLEELVGTWRTCILSVMKSTATPRTNGTRT